AVSDVIFQTITDFKLTDCILNLGYISHHDAIAEQRKSQVLLLIEIDSEDTKSIIPGKLFEYLVSGRPILAIGPKDSDFAEIIINTNTGAFFAYHQKQLLKAKIVEYYNLFLNQNLIVNAIGIDKYSRKNLTLELTKLL
ncbi:MAG: glycosyl transferase family 1, partial [Flavobacterium sp.]|nr:glycosyl transferase family 1 [Flavobacterium sp.]